MMVVARLIPSVERNTSLRKNAKQPVGGKKEAGARRGEESSG